MHSVVAWVSNIKRRSKLEFCKRFCSCFFLSFLAVINAIIDPSGNLDLLTNNKTCSVLQPEAAKVRTTNNTSGSVLESLSPVKKMNYIQKSNFGSTGLQDKTFVSDGEKYVI